MHDAFEHFCESFEHHCLRILEFRIYNSLFQIV